MYKQLTKAAAMKLQGKTVKFKGEKAGEWIEDAEGIICVEEGNIWLCSDLPDLDGSEAPNKFGKEYSYRIFSRSDSPRTVKGDDNSIVDFMVDDLKPTPESPGVIYNGEVECTFIQTCISMETIAKHGYLGRTLEFCTEDGIVIVSGEVILVEGTGFFFISNSDMYAGAAAPVSEMLRYKRTKGYFSSSGSYTITPQGCEKILVRGLRVENISNKPTPTMKPETPKAVETPNNGFNLTLPTQFVETYLREELGKKLPEAVDAFLQKNANAELEKIVKKEVDKLKPTQVQLNIDGKITQFIMTGKPHSAFKDACRLSAIHKQIMLVGPAGSGKTTLSEQIAKAMELPFHHISCSQGMSEAHITGRMLFDGAYVSSEFVECYENGGVFLFDEIDAADANVLMIINSAIANGYLSLPNRKEKSKAVRHENFICIISGNTFGTGSVEYSGRGYLDAAFLDRFSMSKMFIDYDVTIEKAICEGKESLLAFFHQIRSIIKEKNLKRIVSTRTIKNAVMQKDAGFTDAEIANRFVIDWSKEEKEVIKNYMPKEF